MLVILDPSLNTVTVEGTEAVDEDSEGVKFPAWGPATYVTPVKVEGGICARTTEHEHG